MAQKNGLRRVVLVDGCRIPFQRSGSGYKELTAYDMARLVLSALLRRTVMDPAEIDWVLMGNVVSSMRNTNVARDAALAAGIPNHVPAATVTLACVSSNKAVTDAIDLIRTGQAEAVIAGGTESLTDIPIQFRKPFRQKLIESQKYRKPGDYMKFLKGMSPADILPEIPEIAEFSTGRSMGKDCDRMAARLGVTRREQDEYAERSHRLAAQAAENGLLATESEAVTVPPSFQPVDSDNGIRGDTTVEKLSSLKPAFNKPYGTLTAGNSSFLTDGAAATLLMSEEKAKALGLTPKAVFVDYAYTAQDPEEELLLGPAYATPKVLDRQKIKLKDIDVFEFHEAFAAQMIANLNCLNSTEFAKEKLGKGRKVGEIPLEKLNTRGGSLSIGHPFGATGARLITTAANRLIEEDGQLALVASCAAGAVGNAIVMERFPG